MGNSRYSYWELTVQDTSIEGLLNDLAAGEILFFSTRMVDRVTLSLCVAYSQIGDVREILNRRGSDLLLCRPHGLIPTAKRSIRRRALAVTMLICGVLLGLSNLFVCRIDVRGNERVPTGAVLRAMEEVGAGIGSFWPAFDGERLKTELLLRLEDVQWVAVNYGGGAVEVVLRERRKVPEVIDNDEPVHVVSLRDGVIAEMSVKQGQPAAGVGDTVEKGQVLISGAAVSTMGTTRTVHALGSVRARTWHTMTVRLPLERVKKRYVGHRSLKISMIFGRTRVNFYRNSSIFGDTCDTITMDFPMCIKGVFSLPVRLCVQRCEFWEGAPEPGEGQPLEDRGRTALHTALAELVDDGSVVSEHYAAQTGVEAVTVTLMAECLEEIGVEVPISQTELREIRTLREEAAND